TPKGTRPGEAPKISSNRVEPKHAAQASSRYTPPVPVQLKESPRWVPILMFAFWILGALIIMLYYLGFVPGGRNQWYLFAGMASILAGLWTATKYH
ncbi:MAG: cell division protein CrgA, partial [Ilumatobacteraceae bacterium]